MGDVGYGPDGTARLARTDRYRGIPDMYGGFGEGPRFGPDGRLMEKYVQDGPIFVNIICLVGNALTAMSGFSVLTGGFTGISGYQFVLYLLLVGLGLLDMVIEADIELMDRMRCGEGLLYFVFNIQVELNFWAKFLTWFRGRGAVYVCIGIMLMSLPCVWCFDFVIGIWMLLGGAACLAMSCMTRPSRSFVDSREL